MKNFFPVAFLLLALFLVASEPAYAQVNLGTSSSATNPERSGDATTGLFSSTTGAVSISSGGTEKMRVNATGVGIGTTSPQSLLTINKNASGVPASVGSFISTQLVGADTAVTGMEMDAFGDNTVIHFNRYDGTFSSQSALLSGDDIVSLVAGGYNGSALVTNKAGIQFIAGGNWSSTSTPEYLAFGTTAVGSTTKLERVRIDTTGNVGIGTTSPANPLSVNGVIESQSGGIKFPDGTTQTTASTSGSSGIVSTHVQTFTASGTYTPTTGMTYAKVQLSGGGGAGGGVAASTGGAGGGGQGGGYSEGVFTAASIGSSQTVTIGAGGTGSTGAAGGSGGTTSLGTLLTASGGAGAPATTTSSAGYVPYPNLGGFSSTAGTGGYMNLPGAVGGTATGVSYNNSFYLSGTGGNGIFGVGGAQAVAGYVTGGASTGSTGNNATGYGGGGGGAGNYNLNTSSTAGGNGSAGIAIITEYCTQ